MARGEAEDRLKMLGVHKAGAGLISRMDTRTMAWDHAKPEAVSNGVIEGGRQRRAALRFSYEE
jgi:hypothetical protein